jgi:hypothetical protein
MLAVTRMSPAIKSTVREVVSNVRAEEGTSPETRMIADGIAIEMLADDFGIIVDIDTIKRVMRDNR